MMNRLSSYQILRIRERLAQDEMLFGYEIRALLLEERIDEVYKSINASNRDVVCYNIKRLAELGVK